VPVRPPLPEWGFDPAAARDYNDARDYYYDQRPDLAVAFEADFHRAVDLIRAHPEGSPVVTEEGARKRLLRRFPYNVYYTIESEQIRIWAVAHEKQRPYYWHERLQP
jgi:plasmid stabilization system protein ParE